MDINPGMYLILHTAVAITLVNTLPTQLRLC